MSNSDLSRKSWLACYGEFMQSCLRRFGSAADAEDVAQDALVVAVRVRLGLLRRVAAGLRQGAPPSLPVLLGSGDALAIAPYFGGHLGNAKNAAARNA